MLLPLTRAHGRRVSKTLYIVSAIHCKTHWLLLWKAAEVPARKGCLSNTGSFTLQHTAAHSKGGNTDKPCKIAL